MLEVVFNESTKASMKQSKKKIKNKTFKTKLKKDLEKESIEENFHNVVNIGFSLDIGDISGEIDGVERKKVFGHIYNINPNKSEGRQFFNNQREDLEKLIGSAKEGEIIRIWESSAPFSTCGVAFVCNLLKDINCKINIVKFPEYHQISQDIFLSSASWDSILPDDFYKFLIYEKEFHNIIKEAKANLWEELKRENSPLRAVINGKLISVPEDFYDHIIIKAIPESEFSMISLIGRIIGEYELGITDSWLALRINKMIEDGKLELLSDNKTVNPYERILKHSK